MQLIDRVRKLLLAGCAVMSCMTPAAAQVCTLALSNGGTLGLALDGTVLGSEEIGGLPAAVTIVSVGTNTIDIDAPQRVSGPPAGYNTGTESVELAYQGLGGLAAVSQAYTTGPSGFTVGTIALSVLTLHNRIVNPDGFAPGLYTTRTVLTCS